MENFLPDGHGIYAVGCADVLSDFGRNSVLARLFYPIETSLRLQNAPNMHASEMYAQGYADFIGIGFLCSGLFKRVTGKWKVSASWNAPLSCQMPSSAGWPLMLFSHGLACNRSTYTSMCTDLASHGYIVASVEHRDGSASITMTIEAEESRNCENWVPYTSGGFGNFVFRNNQVNIRSDECINLLEFMLKLNAGTAKSIINTDFDLTQFKDRIDPNSLIMTGHSFGGATCLTVLSKESRFRCGIAIDPWMDPVHQDTYSRVKCPLLILNNELFHWKQNIARLHHLLENSFSSGEEKLVITLLGTSHLTQADFQFIIPRFLGRIVRARYTRDSSEALKLSNTAVLAFVKKQLNISLTEEDENILFCRHEAFQIGFLIKEPNMKLIRLENGGFNAVKK